MTLAWREQEDANVNVEDANKISRFYMPPHEFEYAVDMLGIGSRLVKTYSEGVQAYVFVKQNAGMLKPVYLFFHPVSGKMFLIRKRDENLSSLFVSLDHFVELDAAPASLDHLLGSPEDPLFAVVMDVKDLPHLVIWFNTTFSGLKPPSLWRRICQRCCCRRRSTVHLPGQKYLILFFDEAKHRDTLMVLIAKAAEKRRPRPVDILVRQSTDFVFTPRKMTVKMPAFLTQQQQA